MEGLDEYRISRVNTTPNQFMSPRLTGESSIVYTDEEEGLASRVEELELKLANLLSYVSSLKPQVSTVGPDMVPGPIDAYTTTELTSDGALLSALVVSVPSDQTYEIALFPVPTSGTCTKDSYVRYSNKTTNYNGGDLWVGNQGDQGYKRTLVDVPHDYYAFGPPVVASGYWACPAVALLRLKYHWEGPEGTRDELKLYAYGLEYDSATWTEAGVTWNNQPSAEGEWTDCVFADQDDDYIFFNLASYFSRRRAHSDCGVSATVNGFAIMADETLDEGEVAFYSKDNAPDEDSKPTLLYWAAPEKSKVVAGGAEETRLYGKPGGDYMFMYRVLDANNNPSRWSLPVEISLPGQGDTPAAPTVYLEPTNMNFLDIMTISGTTPADFAYYEIYMEDNYPPYPVKTIKTRADRFTHSFVPVMGDPTEKWTVKARIVTKSGVVSAWSSTVDHDVGDSITYYGPNEDGAISIDVDGHVSIKQEGTWMEIMPAGVIVMWPGLYTAIPAGWALCDGTGGTPDLRNKFIRGAAAGQSGGSTGGTDSNTLTTMHLPQHAHLQSNHTHTTGAGSAHRHALKVSNSPNYWAAGSNQYGPYGGAGSIEYDDLTNESAHTHEIASSGGGGATGYEGQASPTALDNKPAYYTLCFIEKL